MRKPYMCAHVQVPLLVYVVNRLNRNGDTLSAFRSASPLERSPGDIGQPAGTVAHRITRVIYEFDLPCALYVHPVLGIWVLGNNQTKTGPAGAETWR